MPIISKFYGIIITMYMEEDGKHHKKHIHIKYNNYKAIFDFEGNLISGKIPNKQKKMVQAWIAIHEEELYRLWKNLQEGKEHFKIKPLE